MALDFVASVIAKYFAIVTVKGFEEAVNKIRDAWPNDHIFTHTYPKSYVGDVLIEINNIQEDTQIMILWGPWACRVDLAATNKQHYLILQKGNYDSVPLTLFSQSKVNVNFKSSVTNMADKWVRA